MADDTSGGHASTDAAAGLTESATAIRDTAKWLVGGLGAIGVAFAAGIQLTSLGSVTDGGRLLISGICVIVCISALAWAVARTLEVLLPPTLNLTAISELPATDPIVCYIAANADEYLEGEGAAVGGPGGFREHYLAAITARKAAIAAQDDTPEKQKLAQTADDRVVYLNAIAAKVAGLANLFRLKAAFATWKRDVIGAVIVVAFAIALFGWAANPPKADASPPNLAGASLVGADLSKADLKAADLTGADLTDAILLNAKLEGATFDRVTWKNTTCPDGVNSDKAGGTCTGHLE